MQNYKIFATWNFVNSFVLWNFMIFCFLAKNFGCKEIVSILTKTIYHFYNKILCNSGIKWNFLLQDFSSQFFATRKFVDSFMLCKVDSTCLFILRWGLPALNSWANITPAGSPIKHERQKLWDTENRPIIMWLLWLSLFRRSSPDILKKFLISLFDQFRLHQRISSGLFKWWALPEHGRAILLRSDLSSLRVYSSEHFTSHFIHPYTGQVTRYQKTLPCLLLNWSSFSLFWAVLIQLFF